MTKRSVLTQQIETFDQWQQALRETVPAKLQRAYREAIVKFLYWLRETGKAADITAFKEHPAAIISMAVRK